MRVPKTLTWTGSSQPARVCISNDRRMCPSDGACDARRADRRLANSLESGTDPQIGSRINVPSFALLRPGRSPVVCCYSSIRVANT